MQPEASAACDDLLSFEDNGVLQGAIREAAMEAVLVASTEVGYRQVSVQTILERSGGYRTQFYEHFASKEDCFSQAYNAWMHRLCIDLLEAAAASEGWEAGVRNALIRLFRFTAERPAIAQALLVEGQIAGEPALAKYEAAVERLAAALDSVRSTIEPDDEPPKETGAFVIGGITSCVCEAVSGGDPERLWNMLPELMHFVVGSYLSTEAAEAAFEDASLLLERNRARLAEGAG